MADIIVAPLHWRELKNSANCFLPRLVAASAGNPGFSNADLARAATKVKVESLSAHAVGNGLKLAAVKHAKAKEFISAYVGLDSEIQNTHGAMDDNAIVAAYLAIPNLKSIMDSLKFTDISLSLESKVGVKAIAYATNKGRVTGAIAFSIYRALLSSSLDKSSLASNLASFATSDPDPSLAHRAVKGKPFTLEDLLLPLPADVPSPWY